MIDWLAELSSYWSKAKQGNEIREHCYYIEITESDLIEIVKVIKENLFGRLITIVGTDQRLRDKGFMIYYVFGIDAAQEHLVLAYRIDEKEEHFPSITPYLPAANWFEREIQDLFGLKAIGHPNPSPLVLHGFDLKKGYPLRKDTAKDAAITYANLPLQFTKYESDDVVQVPVGPIHAGVIEPGHFRFGAIGDSVLHLDAQLFYTHRGIEKTSEGLSVEEALQLAERICGVDVISHAISFSQAIEKIGKIEIPKRAQYLRSIYLELERLYNHVGDVGNLGAGVGFAFAVSQGLRIKEELLRLNERYLGHRYLRDLIAIGGVKKDISNQALEQMVHEIGFLLQDFREMADVMMKHEIVLNRMKNTGILRLKEANDLETVGIAARASGRNLDVRRDYPHDMYKDIDFNVSIYNEGDVFARAMIRVDEIKESFSLIKQWVKSIPEGEIQIAYGELPSYQWALGVTESARGENVHWVMVGPNQTIERYRIRSAPYMNWPAVPLTVPGNIIPDFPLINKSFELCYACCDR
ncbi:NADH-quinone oxidoreductase subunit C [Tepidibacillus infernus]|uniref:NADH dehydrogenase n=1 Tax=Tepidibacillus decaturensis TaxID=1413211 RepID=A0A135L5D9_9BACI|nr:NADH-quinone oxidoreductase subunit C [Tepidibacillus decaturensis]KXG44149.1 NADH dehydrogenase [Tepidibacillus decaturensis]